MSEKLTFVLLERIDETYEHERDDVWSDKCGLADEDRAQLLELALQPLVPGLTDDALLKGKAREIFTGALEGFDDYPLEVWDLIGADEEPRYRVWLFHGNRGLLLESATEESPARTIGEIHACVLHGVYEHVDYHAFEELRTVLQAAQKRAKRSLPTAELAWVEF